jgi:hypothetical protein
MYSKFVVETTIEDQDTRVDLSRRFNVNADVILIAFDSVGADGNPPMQRLEGTYADETDLADYRRFEGQIGDGKFVPNIAPDVTTKGDIVDGPPEG